MLRTRFVNKPLSYLLFTCSKYNENLYNLKIEVPEDDNYSDDELTFFPYYTYFTNTQDPVKVSHPCVIRVCSISYAVCSTTTSLLT